MNYTQSFHNTISSNTSGSIVSQVFPLKYLIKNTPLTMFAISITNSDGTRKSDQQGDKENHNDSKAKKGNKVPQISKDKSNALKIQFLLDQRKPPTEKLPSLCA
mmetsp:Transcript_8467/g.14221  ORF Transcript_8467/g.14221 Transcript_8467/m.14221 type:complete len:104 (-) Transcript_8467:65-376(-)